MYNTCYNNGVIFTGYLIEIFLKGHYIMKNFKNFEKFKEDYMDFVNSVNPDSYEPNWAAVIDEIDDSACFNGVSSDGYFQYEVVIFEENSSFHNKHIKLFDLKQTLQLIDENDGPDGDCIAVFEY